jgi:hypothetical protein
LLLILAQTLLVEEVVSEIKEEERNSSGRVGSVVRKVAIDPYDTGLS